MFYTEEKNIYIDCHGLKGTIYSINIKARDRFTEMTVDVWEWAGKGGIIDSPVCQVCPNTYVPYKTRIFPHNGWRT